MVAVTDPASQAPELREILRSWAGSQHAVFTASEIEEVLASAPSDAVALDRAYRRALGLTEELPGLELARARSSGDGPEPSGR